MKAYPNIEKTAFCKKGEYTGYADGLPYSQTWLWWLGSIPQTHANWQWP